MRFLSTIIFVGLCALNFSALGQNVFSQNGQASYYADKFEGRQTASGDKYNASKMTAAHLLLPFGTIVKVTNLKNNKTVEVEINDRGPFVEGRIIDLSRSAAEAIDMVHEGLADVKIEVIEHSDDMQAGKPVIKRANRDQPEHEKLYYEVHAEKKSPSGFGVQIASFRELVNMMELTHNLKSSFQKDVIVEVGDLNGIQIYKVIIGNIGKRGKAQELKIELQADYPECFVYEF